MSTTTTKQVRRATKRRNGERKTTSCERRNDDNETGEESSKRRGGDDGDELRAPKGVRNNEVVKARQRTEMEENRSKIWPRGAKVEERRDCGLGGEEQRFEKREETSLTIRGAAVREDKVSILGGSKQI